MKIQHFKMPNVLFGHPVFICQKHTGDKIRNRKFCKLAYGPIFMSHQVLNIFKNTPRTAA
jgi:hypothetical protein